MKIVLFPIAFRKAITFMEKTILNLTAKMTLTTGASDLDIERMVLSIPYALPEVFLEFLKFSNGVKGRIGNKFLIIWGTNDIISINEGYNVKIFAPGLLLFGSDGGNEGYGFDFRGGKMSIVEIPFICMDWESAKIISHSFVGFLSYMNE